MSRYTPAVVTSGLLFALGFALAAAVLVHYVTHDFSLPSPSSALDHLGIIGLQVMIIGFSTFYFTLVLHATEVRYGERNDG
jgi:hypothetical protein